MKRSPSAPLPQHAAAPPSRRDPLAIAMLACVALAAIALRLGGLTRDLPWFADEAAPFRIALSLWGWGDAPATANPHTFHYPSLAIDLHWLVQALVVLGGLATGRYHAPADAALDLFAHPARFVVPARLLNLAADTASALLAARLGGRVSRFAGLAAGLVVAVAPAALQSAVHLAVDPLVMLGATLATVALAALARTGGRGTLVRAALACGLAAGAKYSAAPLLAALVLAWWVAPGRRAWGELVLALALALAAFLATTPFALLDARTFAADAGYEWHHLIEGHFGTSGPVLGVALGALTRNLGPALVALLAAGIVLGGTADRERLVLRAIVLLLLAPVLLAHTFAARYLLPGLPAAAVLAAATAQPVLARVRAGGLVKAAALALLVAPVALAARGAAFDRTPGAVAQAMAWCEAHVGEHDVVLQEAGALPAPGSADLERLYAGRAYAAATSDWKYEMARVRRWPFVNVPFAASGDITVPFENASGGRAALPVFAPAWRANDVPYVAPVTDGATIYVSSSAIRDRFERNPAAWPRVTAWYRALDATAAEHVTFRGGDPDDPAITLWRLAPVPAHGAAPLGRDWWLAGATPEAIARLGARALTDPSLDAADRRRGGLARARAFASHWEPFLDELARLNGRAGRPAEARALARLVLSELPGAPWPVRTYLLATLDLTAGASGGPTAHALLDSLRVAGADRAAAQAELARLSGAAR